MRYAQLFIALILLSIGTVEPALSKSLPALDIVTMKNGNIFNGKVVQDAFILKTVYGRVSVPYALTEQLWVGDGTNPDRIRTRHGDTFIGKLTQQALTIHRVLGTALPLDTKEIADIAFSPRGIRRKTKTVPDVVETKDGSLFSVRIVTRDFILKSARSIKLINRSDIHLMDFADIEDDAAIEVRINLNGGDRIQGRLATNKIRVQDRYGDMLEIPVGELIALAFSVNHQQLGAPRFNYRMKVPAGALIRDSMRDGTPGPEMVALRGGEYRRGDLQGDGDGDEQPSASVRLQPFAIGIYEVTFEEYDRFCVSSGQEKPDDEGGGRGRRPVVNINWDSARAFADWLSRQTGETYRLPTDAEWEYAARAGTRTRFWWGNDSGVDQANCSGCGSLWDGEKASSVGKFDPNPYGLHDTAGNVFEWVADCWNDSFSEAPSDGSALEKPSCSIRVIRGGAWSFPPKEVRSANRWRNFQSRRSDDTGFRLVRELNGE